MSPKMKTKTKSAKSAPAPKAKAGNAKASAAKTASKKVMAPPVLTNSNSDMDDAADDMEMSSSRSSSPSIAAMSDASRVEETSSGGVSKNFRSHPDMENFYRFLHEHDLRIEALEIIDQLIEQRKDKKKKPTLN